MNLSSLLLVFCLIYLSSADRKPKKYTINLDDDPLIRWNHVIQDHKYIIPAMAEQTKAFVPAFLQPIVWWITGKLSYFFPDEYAKELEGISKSSGLPLGEVVGMNILYDIAAFDRRHVFKLGCTSIVAEDSNGRIWHGRNLDYEMGDLLKNITILVDFKKNGQVVYSGTTFVLYAGLLTGERPYGYTVSLNARYSGAYIDNILMEFYTHFKRPVSFFIREVLSTVSTYSEAVDRFSSTHLFSPSYIVVGGMKSGEGAIISRNRMKAADVFYLNSTDNRWFLVETNFDHWKGDSDRRRITATDVLTSMGQSQIDDAHMMKVLSTFPVYNNQTLFSTVMSARYPMLLAKSIIIRED